MRIAMLLRTMISLFAAMLVGYLAVRLRLVDGDFKRQLSRLVLYLIHPLMILSSVMNTQHLLTNVQVIQLIGVILCCYAVLIPLSRVWVKLLRVEPGDRGTFRFMLVFSNMGFMGFPVVRSLFGADAGFYVTIFVLLFQLMVYTYGVHFLADAAGEFRVNARVFLTPMIVSALLALVIYFTGIRVPAVVAETATYVGDVSTPACMMIIGCTLAELPVRSIVGSWRLYALVGIKMLLMPLVAYGILRLVLHNELVLGITTVLLAMPVASNAAMMALEYGGNRKLAASGVFLTTLLSIFTIPAIMWLLFRR